MIISTGVRTDIVQHYTPWLLKRLEQGYALSRNPFSPDRITRYDLTPDKVDCVVFCSKNYEPILPHMEAVLARFPVYCHYTITAYGRDMEPGVPSIERSMDTLERLAKIVGRRRIAWRYDPILLSREYTVERHLETFAAMAVRLAPHIDRCIFNFVEIYKKLERNMPRLAPVPPAERDRIARGLGAVAQRCGIAIQTCGLHGDYTRYGIQGSGCITLDMLGEANGLDFRTLRHRGKREGCRCIESRDIGAFNTCPNGCRYCYANASPETARRNWLGHDPDSPLLCGRPRLRDVVVAGRQKSFLAARKRAPGEEGQTAAFLPGLERQR